MTRRIVLHALAIAASALAFGTPAEAGGGVRLTFGGPLPSFVATPTPGYGSGYSAPRKAAPRVHVAKRKQTAPTVLAEHPKPKASRYVVPVRHTTTSNAPKAGPAQPVTAYEGDSPGFISRTLAIDNLPRAETIHAAVPSETIVAKDAPGLKVADAPMAAKSEAAPKRAAANKPATCRKFIPAVGVTVTVACE